MTTSEPTFVMARWSRDAGWDTPHLASSSRMDLAATTSFIHYGQSVFEGMRAHRTMTGRTTLFRARDHHRRFATSAARMSLPPVPWEHFRAGLEQFVAHHAGALRAPGDSVYLRPVLLASTETLGINEPVHDCLFVVTGLVNFRHVATDVGLRVRVERDLRRSWPGGVGAVKCAGNYGLARLGQDRARAAGCEDALWLSGAGHVGELSSMNVFVVERGGRRDRLVTPRADGLILSGVTRRSLLDLADALDLVAAEEQLAIDDVLAGLVSGTVTEVFATGTASGVVPVGAVRDRGRWVDVPQKTAHGRALGELLTQVQTEREPDRRGWLLDVDLGVDVGAVL